MYNVKIIYCNLCMLQHNVLESRFLELSTFVQYMITAVNKQER